MGKLLMLAGGIVEPGGGQPGAVSAYVAFNPAPGKSRLFKVQGPTDAPRVSELPGATTVDLGRFKTELAEDLQPALDAIAAQGGKVAIASPKQSWVTGVVERHLAATEGS